MRFSKTVLVKVLRPLTSGLLVAFVLLLNAMAASPTLHEFFHADAGQAEHQCAATLFAHGQVDSPVVDVAVILPVLPVEFSPHVLVSVSNALVESLPPGRGPPVSTPPA